MNALKMYNKLSEKVEELFAREVLGGGLSRDERELFDRLRAELRGMWAVLSTMEVGRLTALAASARE